MKGHDPIGGCIHGGPMDPDLRGLTKREWLFGQALSSLKCDLDVSPEKAVDWAYKCMEVALKYLKQEKV